MRDDGRVVRVHARDGGDAQGLGDPAGQGAPEAVAARVERRAGQHEVRAVASAAPRGWPPRLVLALRDMVVAADERRDDRALPAQDLLERAPRPDGPLSDLERCVGLLLAPDPAEELVHVVHDAGWLSHDPSSRRSGLRAHRMHPTIPHPARPGRLGSPPRETGDQARGLTRILRCSCPGDVSASKPPRTTSASGISAVTSGRPRTRPSARRRTAAGRSSS